MAQTDLEVEETTVEAEEMPIDAEQVPVKKGSRPEALQAIFDRFYEWQEEQKLAGKA